MGGADAEVDETTRSIIIESAYFNPSAVRATARALGLSSDSSYRFERGVDPQGVVFAALRALDLILATAGGTQVGAMLTAGSMPEIIAEIEISPAFIRQRIGFPVDDSIIKNVFSSLELGISEHERDTDDIVWRVRIPSFRGDLERPIDLVEEFIRVYGTDKIPRDRVEIPAVAGADARVYRFFEDASRLLTGAGFDEALLYSLRSREEVELWFGAGSGEALALANPLASDQSHLRPSLIPGLLDVLRFNNARQTGARRFFERGRVFREQDGAVTEYAAIGFVVLLQADSTRWKQREQADFYTARALVEELLALAEIRVQAADFLPVDEDQALWQHGHAAAIIDNKRGFGLTAGLLDGKVLARWDIDQPVLAGSLLIRPEYFERLKTKRHRYQPLSEFPATVRDIALLVDTEESAGTVTAQLKKIVLSEIKEYVLESIDLFDNYSGKGIPEGKRSLAFSLRFRAADRTLREDEVNPAFERMQARIASDTAYTVRSE
jgi:phenylalanyl-tRNA synthetase beta chain